MEFRQVEHLSKDRSLQCLGIKVKDTLGETIFLSNNARRRRIAVATRLISKEV